MQRRTPVGTHSFLNPVAGQAEQLKALKAQMAETRGLIHQAIDQKTQELNKLLMDLSDIDGIEPSGQAAKRFSNALLGHHKEFRSLAK